MLEKSSIEERFQVDVWLGDINFETSYSLPGEEVPPKVRADISLEWPTWSQSNYRSWTLGEGSGEGAELAAEIALRLQSTSSSLDAQLLSRGLPSESPEILGTRFTLTSISSEHSVDLESGDSEYGVEFLYETTFHLEDSKFEDGMVVERELTAIGPWVASLLVKVADLRV